MKNKLLIGLFPITLFSMSLSANANLIEAAEDYQPNTCRLESKMRRQSIIHGEATYSYKVYLFKDNNNGEFINLRKEHRSKKEAVLYNFHLAQSEGHCSEGLYVSPRYISNKVKTYPMPLVTNFDFSQQAAQSSLCTLSYFPEKNYRVILDHAGNELSERFNFTEDWYGLITSKATADAFAKLQQDGQCQDGLFFLVYSNTDNLGLKVKKIYYGK